MKNIIIVTITLLLFVGCKSGSSDTGDTSITIPITESCNDTNDITNYQVVQSGDKILQEDTSNPSSTAPKVEIFETASGEKKVCIKSGTAVIIR